MPGPHVLSPVTQLSTHMQSSLVRSDDARVESLDSLGLATALSRRPVSLPCFDPAMEF